jgi:hypothetical protein
VKNPGTKWLFASYAEKLSIRDSRYCRYVILSEWYRRHWGHVYGLVGDQNAKLRFDNDKMGYRLATSVGGLATGEGGDRIVCLTGDARIACREPGGDPCEGGLPIGELVEGRLNVEVLTWDGMKGGAVWKPIQRWMSREHEGDWLVRVRTMSGRELTLTPNHRLLTVRGWVPAGELAFSDDVFLEPGSRDGRAGGWAGGLESVERIPTPTVVEVEYENGDLDVLGEDREVVERNRGMVMAGELRVGDEVIVDG